MLVELRSISRTDNMTPEEFIVYCARVSNPANQYNNETAPKLLQYLIKNRHWSPFEMVSMTLEINSTRDIIRQILRHRSFSFQEFSQRYADPTANFGFVIRDARLQDKKNRQNSLVCDDQQLQDEWAQRQQEVIELAKLTYFWAVSHGIAKEQARVVLPEGNTPSRIYMTGTIRSWYHYCEVRCKPDTQLEHREIANAAWDILLEQIPSLYFV